jgi:hypothetical protein
VKFTLELDLSSEEFANRSNSDMVQGGSIGFYLTEAAKRIDGHAMAAGENGKILSDDDDTVIGSWRIEP